MFDSGTEIDNFAVPASYANNLGEIEIGAKMFGWRFTGKPGLVEAGQYLVPVARIPRDDD